MSVLTQLLDAVATAIGALGLNSGGLPVPVLVFKENTVRPQIDTVPIFTVAPAEGGSRERAFTGSWWVRVPVRVTLINNGNLDLLTELGTEVSWREGLTALLEEPGATGIACVAGVEVDESQSPVDPAMLERGYDVTSIRLIFITLQDH